MGIKRTKTVNVKQILANTDHFFSVGTMVNDAGVVAENGRKIIKAGTPLGGATKTIADSTAILSVVDDGTVQGVALFDVDVTEGKGNASLLIWGFVNEFRLDSSVTINDAVKKALDGKVTFVKRNK
ncbi:hypothetical protein AB6831_04300 [Carnobacterium divergens]|uniref:hypothetical protein n=1 Tax=Carnobacterium divergens TaxID=2748 RepID=UPI0039C9DC2F